MVNNMCDLPDWRIGHAKQEKQNPAKFDQSDLLTMYLYLVMLY